jgi:pimeloyl-ACP methyl ester carboxylesterase
LHQNTHFLTKVLDGAFSFDVDALEEPFTSPCLIITGKQDTEVGYRDQFQYMNIYTNSTYIALNRAGHNLQIEQPELFETIVGNWLADNMRSFKE